MSLIALALVTGAGLLAASDGDVGPVDLSVLQRAAPVVEVPSLEPELVDFVRAARYAEEGGDRLQRCLAFPDWPGQAWPAGLAAAHCRLLFDPVPSLADVAAALESGDLAAIDDRYGALLARHVDPAQPDETVHRALAQFDVSAQADAVSARWVALAPDSAWARVARAAHLQAVALHLLDGAGDGPVPEARRSGTALAVEAEALHHAALAVEPRMLPAQAGLAALALARGDAPAAVQALAAGEALDPACLPLARARLAQLGPRHGGTDAAADAYLRSLRAAHPARVLLALAGAEASLARGRSLLRHDRFDEAQVVLRPTLVGTTAPEAFEDAAIAAVRARVPDHEAALGLLVAASRFQSGRQVVRELRARLLMQAGERAWALRILDEAPAEPEALSTLIAAGPRRATEPLAR